MLRLLALIPEGAAGQDGDMRAKAHSALAIALAAQNLFGEARDMAGPACRRPPSQRDVYYRRLYQALEMMKLCS